MTDYLLRHALIGGEVIDNVGISVDDGVISAVGRDATTGTLLDGLVLPGIANAHSHAFHRALRGRTHEVGGGSFWTWRDLMYAVAARLDPDTYFALARATFAEMLESGFTAVGEFHYLHHQGDGTPYDDPNAMSKAVAAAAEDVGIRITVLETLYLHGGLDADGYSPLSPSQRRFSDRSAERFLVRTAELADSELTKYGRAIHSIRAVDPDSIEQIASTSDDGPLHIHLSEQRDENTQCLAAHDRTPTELLADAGLISPRLTAVHATHLSPHDIGLLGSDGASICLCPTTERDLADGIGPGRALASAGASVCIGSDSHAVVDPFEEMRGVEMHERLVSQQRAVFESGELLAAGSANGYRAIGWDGGGLIEVGAPADLICVGLESRRLAGGDPALNTDAVVYAATSSDVIDVVVAGRHVVRDRAHVNVDTARELTESIRAVLT